MKGKIKSIIVIILITTIFISIGLISSLARTISAEATENANKVDINIKSEIIDSLHIVTAECDYEEVITRKETWIMGLNPSIAMVKVKGNIKVGSELIDVKKEKGKYIINLSEPKVLQHEIEKEGNWETREGILNEFDSKIEGEVFEKTKKSVEERLFDELKQKSIKNNELAIYSILSQYMDENINEDNCKIVYLAQ
jgi:hypothetical protein